MSRKGKQANGLISFGPDDRTAFMRCLLLLVLLAMISPARANDSAFRSYFTYPDVQITMDYGVDVGHAQAIPFKNHLNPTPTAASQTPVFQGGCKMTGSRPDDPRVQWRFIDKTESGDLYLISIYQKERLSKEVPVIYTGSAIVAYDHDHITITLESPGDAKWKAP